MLSNYKCWVSVYDDCLLILAKLVSTGPTLTKTSLLSIRTLIILTSWEVWKECNARIRLLYVIIVKIKDETTWILAGA